MDTVTSTLELPVVLVAYGLGSLSPLEIKQACTSLCRPVFVVKSDLAPELLAVAQALGQVVDERDMYELRALRPAGIVTFSDARVEAAARIAELLTLRFHSPATARSLADKAAQRAALTTDGVRWMLVSELEDVRPALERVGRPAVAKPSRGTGGRHTYLLRDVDDAEAILSPLLEGGEGPFVIEEFLESVGVDGADVSAVVSIETLVVDGVSHHLTTTGRMPFEPPFREAGAFMPARLPQATVAAMEAVVDAAVADLGARDGFLHTELKLTPDGPRIVEVNGRLGGYIAALLKTSSGIDAARLAFEAALGSAAVPAVDHHNGVSFVRFLLPPLGASRLESVGDLDVVRSLDAIRAVRFWSAPGREVDWTQGYAGSLGAVLGCAVDHEQLPDLVDAVDRAMALRFS